MGNKIRKAHVFFRRKKMSVKLATQLTSKLVTEAFDFCREELKLKQFEGSNATAEFLRLLNDVFDVLNSHNLVELGFKKALCKSNLELVSKAVDYIGKLRFPSHELVVQSRRGTEFIGIIICLKNLKHIYEKLITSDMLYFVPTYKLNQDHLELFYRL